MNATEIRELTAEQRQEELDRLYREVFVLRMQKSADQLPQTHLIRSTRRIIARIKTIQKELESGN